jgi:hypothetical protein
MWIILTLLKLRRKKSQSKFTSHAPFAVHESFIQTKHKRSVSAPLLVMVGFFQLKIAESSGDEETNRDPGDEEAPVLLRRKRYIRRKDRAVNSLASALNPENFDMLPPRKDHFT